MAVRLPRHPIKVKVHGRRMYKRRKGGRTYSFKQIKAMYATGGWARPVRKRRRSKRRRR